MVNFLQVPSQWGTCHQSAALPLTCGLGRLPAISVLINSGGPRRITSLLRGELEEKDNREIFQALAHPGCHQRCHMDLQKPAGEKAHADPLCGYKPNGISTVQSTQESLLCSFRRGSQSHTQRSRQQRWLRASAEEKWLESGMSSPERDLPCSCTIKT